MTSSRLVRALTAGTVAVGASFIGNPPAVAQDASAPSPPPPAEAPADAGSGGQIEEIVVTAQRREEASRDVPITITSLSVDQLATANVTQLSDTAKLTPGLRFDTQG